MGYFGHTPTKLNTCPSFLLLVFIRKARATSCTESNNYIMLANSDIALAFSAQRGKRGRASSRRPRTITPVAELGNSAVTRKDFNFRTIQIIPSVLPADWANMGHCVKELETAGVDRIQFDVMDGNFVPNLTFGPEMIKACRKYCNTPFETQLMVSQYASEVMLEEYVEATKGPNGEPGVVIIHVEACDHLQRTLVKIRELGGSPSVALNPHPPFEMVKNVLCDVDHVLVMTVNPYGVHWRPIPSMIDKIAEIRAAVVENGYDVDIEVDGGIKADWTLSQCAAAGANCFIAGSGMFAYPTLKEGCDALRAVALEAQAGKVLESA